MRRRILSILGVLAVAAAFTFTSCDSTAGTSCDSTAVTSYATLTVTVKDYFGNAVSGATVATSVSSVAEIKSARAVAEITATTNADGVAVLEGMVAGSYTLFVDSPIVDGAATYLCYSGSVSITQNTFYGNSFYNAATSVTLPKLGGSYTTGAIYVNKASDTTQDTDVLAAADTVNFYLPSGSGYKYAVIASGAISSYTDFVSATTSDAGIASFTNLPLMYFNGNMKLVIDETGYEAGGYNVPYSAFTLGSNETGNTLVEDDRVVVGIGYDGLALMSTNTVNNASNYWILSPSDNIVLTFNKAITGGTAVLRKWNGTGPIIESAVTVSGSTITVNPNTDLLYGTWYYLAWTALDSAENTSGNFGFGTIADPNAPVAIANLAINTESGITGKFDSNTYSFPVTFTYNEDYTYAVYSQYTDDATWNVGTIDYESYGTLARATVITADPTVSGKTLRIKIVATSGDLTADSNILSITDQIASTARVWVLATVWATNYPVAATTTTDAENGLWKITITGDPNEVLGEVTATFTNANATVTWNTNADGNGNILTGYVSIPSTNLAAYGTVEISLKDKAGNKFNWGTVAVPDYTTTVTLN